MDASPLAVALGTGFVLGIRHSFDPDHLAAMGTIAVESRSLLRSAVVGAMWGVGHTTSLLLCGLVVLSLRVTIPERIALGLEMGVAAMLVGLGVILILRSARGEMHVHAHSHPDGVVHAHIHAHEDGFDASARDARLIHAHAHGVRGFLAALVGRSGSRLGTVSRRPFWVGIVHGLAGTAGLVVLVGLEAAPGLLPGIAYIVLFGAGLVVGMMIVSSLLSVPFLLPSRRLFRLNAAARFAAGLASATLGLVLAYEIGFVDGLFGG